MLFATGIPREVAKFSMIRQREIMEYQNKKNGMQNNSYVI